MTTETVHRAMRAVGLLLGLMALGIGEAHEQQASGAPAVAAVASVTPEDRRMWMAVGEHRFAMTLADSATARAFAAQLPLTLDMTELNGNEKHGKLSQALPANASRPGTVRDGDLMLYGSNTLVVFYLTFESMYTYTRLGRVNDPTGLAQALGRGDVRIVFSKD